MNIAPAVASAPGILGLSAKAGKGSDPLADFMAMLDQLGIAIDGISPGPAASPEVDAESIAAKLLAKLGKIVSEPAGKSTEDASPDLLADQATEDGKADDPVATLADLLAKIDAKPDQTGNTASLDIASLIAAVRAFAAGDAKVQSLDGAVASTADPVKLGRNASIASVKAKSDAKVATIAANAAPTDAIPLTDAPEASPNSSESNAKPQAPTVAPSLASLLARAKVIKQDEAPATIAPGKVQSFFARLEALAAREAGNAEIAPEDSQGVEKRQATMSSSAGQPVAKPQGSVVDRLNAIASRLATATEPASEKAPTPTTNAPIAPKAPAPRTDTPVSELAQAIQQAAKDDKRVNDAPAQPAADAVSNVTPLAAAAASTPAPVTPDAAGSVPSESNTTDISDGLHRHHLDLVRDSQWLDALARDITRAAQSDTQLRFQLNPEHLGSLKVELVNGTNGTSVKLTADTETARAILADAQPRLVAEARAQGLRISEAHVDLSGHGGSQRHFAETPVIVRTTGNVTAATEVEQDMPAASGERYA